MPHVSSEKLRTGLVDCQKKITDTFQPLGIEVDLLRDNVGSDPGLTGKTTPRRGMSSGAMSIR